MARASSPTRCSGALTNKRRISKRRAGRFRSARLFVWCPAMSHRRGRFQALARLPDCPIAPLLPEAAPVRLPGAVFERHDVALVASVLAPRVTETLGDQRRVYGRTV